ncbi:hypothetical protein B0T10DRAFT_462684 [Thelonectria olida]|uniref:Uncharacterized protein n=1 Tax=Thelonectria olida TaxID=1576542 RepID=A0A9P9APS3_9HYPO|nr:hypothetical protein B0T10DRAFT_462684 [Thelonectria olida]
MTQSAGHSPTPSRVSYALQYTNHQMRPAAPLGPIPDDPPNDVSRPNHIRGVVNRTYYINPAHTSMGMSQPSMITLRDEAWVWQYQANHTTTTSGHHCDTHPDENIRSYVFPSRLVPDQRVVDMPKAILRLEEFLVNCRTTQTSTLDAAEALLGLSKTKNIGTCKTSQSHERNQ